MPTAWENINNVKGIDNIPKNIPKIAVAIPYNSKWEPEWVERTYRHLRCTPLNWCVKMVFFSKVPSLPVARDTLVNQALQSGCDYIFFLDTDILFESPQDPNDALNILYQCMNKDKLDKDAKIVSGLYRAKQKQGFNYAMWMRANEKGFTPIQKWNGNWLNIDVTGLGCCLIDMAVFRNIPKPWFYWEVQDSISEDFYFFQLAKKHGYSTHIFTDVQLSHLGGLKVKFDGTIVTPDM